MTSFDRRPAFRGYFAGRGRTFQCRSGEGELELDLYDELTPAGISAAEIRTRLAAFRGSRIRLRINSPGGDVFEGHAIYNDLVNHPAEVEVIITGLAASAASLVAMAGKRIFIAPNAFVMIHNAWALVIGDKGDMVKMAGVLGQIDGVMASTYAARTGRDVAEITRMMDDETWLAGEAAVAAGFADRALDDAPAAQAHFDVSRFRHPPSALAEAYDATAPSVRDAERALREAGYSRGQAKAIIAGGIAALSSPRDAADDDPAHPALRDAGADRALTAALGRLQQTLVGSNPHA